MIEYNLANVYHNATVVKEFYNHLDLRKPIWLRIDDTTSRRHGTIGKIESIDITGLKRVGSITNLMQRFIHAYEKLPFIINSKTIKLVPNDQKLIWMVDYTGPGVNKYNKNINEPTATYTDVLKKEISIGAIIAASSGQGMVIGKITKIFREKYGPDFRHRVTLTVLITKDNNEVDVWRPTNETLTCAIDNVLVLSPEMIDQSLMIRMQEI